MIHGRRRPGRTDGVAATAGLVRHRCRGVRLGSGCARGSGRRRTIVTTREAVRCRGHAVVGNSRRFPGRGGMAGRALRCRADVIDLCDGEAVTGVGVAAGATGYPGVIHRA